jgi:hypothetical protein
MSEHDEAENITQEDPQVENPPPAPETNTGKDITFTSIAETLKNKENKIQSIEMMAKLQDVMYEHLVADQEDLIRKRDLEKLEKKKHAVKMELECLEIENTKMDTYLKTLTKKHELEILYLHEVCAQKQKIADLSNNHPDINFSHIKPYGEFYREELQNVMKVNVVHTDNTGNRSSSPPKMKISNPTPSNTNKNELSPRTRTLKSREDKEETINISRRATVSGTDLQSCLRSALETKFKRVGSEKEHSMANREENSEWDD